MKDKRPLSSDDVQKAIDELREEDRRRYDALVEKILEAGPAFFNPLPRVYPPSGNWRQVRGNYYGGGQG